MIEPLVFVIAGLAVLWLGAEILIDSARKIAEKLKISPFFIGLAFVSIGTSIPEIAVSITGGMDRLAGMTTSGLVVGNAVGSAINQITIIVGILALFVVLSVERRAVLKHGIMLLGSVVLLFILGLDGSISRLDGGIAITVYVIYWLSLFITEKVIANAKRNNDVNLLSKFVLLALGIGVVTFSSTVVVENGISLADILGVKQSLIGILLLGLGTGLPELSVALVAIRRNSISISMGDLIGSNICDLLFSLGSGSVIAGFLVEKGILFFDLPMLLLFSILFVGFLWSRGQIDRREGLILVGCYILYVMIKVLYVG